MKKTDLARCTAALILAFATVFLVGWALLNLGMSGIGMHDWAYVTKPGLSTEDLSNIVDMGTVMVLRTALPLLVAIALWVTVGSAIYWVQRKRIKDLEQAGGQRTG